MASGFDQSPSELKRTAMGPSAHEVGELSAQLFSAVSSNIRQSILNDEENGAFVQKILCERCGLTQKQAELLIDLGSLGALDRLKEEVARIFSGQALSEEQLQTIRSLAASMRQDLESALKVLPLSQIEETFPRGQALSDLLEIGPGEQEGSSLRYSTQKFIEERIDRLIDLCQQYEESGTTGILSFCELLGTIGRKARLSVAQLFAEDFLYVLSEYSPVVSSELSQRRPTWRAIATVTAEHDACAEAMKILETYREAYLGLKPKGASEVYRQLGEAQSVRISLLQDLGGNLERIRSQGMNAQTVTELLGYVEVDGRQEFFVELIEAPEVCALYKAVKKHGLTQEGFVNAIENFSGVSWGQQNPETFYETLIAAIQKRSTARGAAVLMSQAQAFLDLTHHADALQKIARNYQESAVIFEGILIALKQGNSKKVEALVRLGVEGPDPQRVVFRRNQILGFSEQQLDSLLQEKYIRPALRRVVEEQTRQRDAAASKVPAPSPNKVHWVDWMLSTLDERQMGIQLSDVQEAANQLESLGRRPRLRALWRMQPQSVGNFCRDVLEFSASESFRLILNSNSLFSLYRDELVREPKRLHQRLAALIEDERQGMYSHIELRSTLREMLSPREVDDHDKVHAAKALSNTPVARQHEIHPFSRILVWGADYGVEGQQRIRDALPQLEIIFFDDDRRARSAFPRLSENDLIIFGTGALTHADFYRLKARARGSDAQSRYLSRTGVPSFINFVGELYSATKRPGHK